MAVSEVVLRRRAKKRPGVCPDHEGAEALLRVLSLPACPLGGNYTDSLDIDEFADADGG